MKTFEASNTLIPALKVLRDEGYALERGGWIGEDGESWFVARRGGREFIAEDPLRLLGLVSMVTRLGEQWQHACSEEEFEELLHLLVQQDEKDIAGDAMPDSGVQ
jgi:hypothetical protein